MYVWLERSDGAFLADLSTERDFSTFSLRAGGAAEGAVFIPDEMATENNVLASLGVFTANPEGLKKKKASKWLKTAEYLNGFNVRLKIWNSLLGDAVFDVIQQTLGHQRVLVEVHQMRRLRGKHVLVFNVSWSARHACGSGKSTVPFSGRRRPQCLHPLSWQHPSPPTVPLYTIHHRVGDMWVMLWSVNFFHRKEKTFFPMKKMFFMSRTWSYYHKISGNYGDISSYSA